MRLVRFNGGRSGIVIDYDTSTYVVDVAGSIDGYAADNRRNADLLSPFFTGDSQNWNLLIATWELLAAPLGELAAFATEIIAEGESPVAREAKRGIRVLPRNDVRLEAPLPSQASRIFAIGANYADHGAGARTKRTGRTVSEASFHEEKREGLPPWGFTVLPDLVMGDGAVVTPPPGTQLLDYEAEMAIVLGAVEKSGRFDAWGVAVWNDFSIRDPHFGYGPAIDRGPMTWSLQKNFNSGKAFGPWLVVDEDVDLYNCDIRLWVNDELRQAGSTKKMIYTFEDCVSHLEQYCRLRPGDIMTSGTPAGTALDRKEDGFLLPGDVVRAEVATVGPLTSSIGEWYGCPTAQPSIASTPAQKRRPDHAVADEN